MIRGGDLCEFSLICIVIILVVWMNVFVVVLVVDGLSYVDFDWVRADEGSEWVCGMWF